MVHLLCIYHRTKLVVDRGTLTGQCFVDEVLHPYVLPISQTVGNNFLFQQDNAQPTEPHSLVGNVSGNRCESDCRSRGREFDPGPVPYFRGD